MLKSLMAAIKTAIGAEVDAPPPSGPANDWLAEVWRRRWTPPKTVIVLTADRFEGTSPSLAVRNARDDDIRQAFALLAAGKKDFLVLSHAVAEAIEAGDIDDEDEAAEDEFIQAVRNTDGSFGLEVSVTPAGQTAILLSSEIVLPAADALEVLLDYGRSGSRWVDACAWRVGGV